MSQTLPFYTFYSSVMHQLIVATGCANGQCNGVLVGALQSKDNGSGSCVPTALSSQVFVAMTPVTNAQVGLPATITTPLTLN